MFYIIINIIFVVISFSLILIGIIYKERKKSEIINKISDKIITFFNKYYKILIGLLFVLTFFTSFFKIGEVPYGMHVDEAGMAYDALSISRYGVDRYLGENGEDLTKDNPGETNSRFIKYILKEDGTKIIVNKEIKV